MPFFQLAMVANITALTVPIYQAVCTSLLHHTFNLK